MMKIRLGDVRKLISEAMEVKKDDWKSFLDHISEGRWRAWQYKNGSRVGEPVEVDADDDREAAQKAAEILKTWWMSVDAEPIPEVPRTPRTNVMITVHEITSHTEAEKYGRGTRWSLSDQRSFRAYFPYWFIIYIHRDGKPDAALIVSRDNHARKKDEFLLLAPDDSRIGEGRGPTEFMEKITNSGRYTSEECEHIAEEVAAIVGW